MIKAVVFDLDDTLISEFEYIKSGYKYIASYIASKYRLDVQIVFQQLVEEFKTDTKNVFNRTLDHFNISYNDKMILILVDIYRNHHPKITFYGDVKPTLRSLKKRGIKTGIISDGYACSQKQKIKSLNAEMLFDCIILTDEYGRNFWKPSPEPFILMSEKLDTDIESMMYVGDNPQKDFAVKKILPIRTVRVIRDGVYKDKEYPEGIKEDLTISSLSEILNYVD